VARAETPTWLPLDRFAEIIGVNPLHFNQLTSQFLPVGSHCGDVWFQKSWTLPDQAGREDVAEAINLAEQRLASEMKYYLLPDWIEDERIRTTRPARPELFARASMNIRGQLKSVDTRWDYVISGGQRQKLPIEVDVGITKAGGEILDLDGDSYFETVRFTVNVANVFLTSECEIRVYYPDTDPLVYLPAMDEWEIKPIKVTLVGNIATIEFKRWQTVLPTPQAIISPVSINGDLDASYLETVDVYRVFNDPQNMAELLWEVDQEPTGCSLCAGAGCPSCAFNSQDGCFHVRDERRGIVAYTPAIWDEANNRFNRTAYAVCRDPDQLRIWYYAGYESSHPGVQCPRIQLDPFLEKIIAHYAAAIIDRNLCSCNNVERFIDHWREDLARTGREVAYQVSPSDLDNPFGTTRGAVEAWRKINTGDWIVHR